jgi:DNA-directed RNA polymerase specialized sigma24 family protein
MTDSMPALPDPLNDFYSKVPNILADRRVSLSDLQRLWLLVFNTVAVEYKFLLTADDSFALSFDALCRCYKKRTAGNHSYILRACRNVHVDWIRGENRRHRRKARESAYEEPWAEIDNRIDLEDAVGRMGREHPLHEQVVRLRWRGEDNHDIAEHLDLGERQVRRVLRQGESWLRHALGEN